MRFLVDRCAGRRLADWLREQGHDCVEIQSLGDGDPGDRAVLDQAVVEGRILVTIDTDFGTLEESARELGISIATARTHLKRVLAKTGARRQAELVRLVLGGPAPWHGVPIAE